MSHGSSSKLSSSFGGLAEVLEPEAGPLASTRSRTLAVPRTPAPIQLQDFAFADTVIANELPEDELAPPSGPIYVNDADGSAQCVTPLAFPLPHAADDVTLGTRGRVAFAHLRHAIRRSFEEMRELWDGTAEIAEGAPPAGVLRRLLAVWSCFQWSRADVTRAAMIGLGVLVTIAAVFATTSDFGVGGDAHAARPTSASARSGEASSAEVRSGHTLDQHTGHKTASRPKR